MPDITTNDLFGFSVGIDNNQILIGAPFNDSDGENVGRTYLFTKEKLTSVSEPSLTLSLLIINTLAIFLTSRTEEA